MIVNPTLASLSEEVSSLEIKNRALARTIACEGIVVLENNGALPLTWKDQRIALYGNGARKTIYGGTGSGEVIPREQINIEQGLKDAGLSITSTKWLDGYDRIWEEGRARFIKEHRVTLKKLNPKALMNLIAEEYQYPSGEFLTQQDLETSDCETCIYVIARQSGEGKDREVIPGDYRLTDVEIANITLAAGYYRKFILVINTGASMDLQALEGIQGVDAIVYMSLLGMESGHALADILYGKVNPCGHLAATWARHYEQVPGATDFGRYAQEKAKSQQSKPHANALETDVAYVEEGLVGYRWYDAKGIKPRYAFGHGLSYTSFQEELLSVEISSRASQLASIPTKENGCLRVRVEVTNTGSRAGRHVVGIYLGYPQGYEKTSVSTYERPGKILAGYAKTALIEAGRKEEITMDIPFSQLTVYDESKKSMRVLAGEYELYMGLNAMRSRKIRTVRIEAAGFSTDTCSIPIDVCQTPTDVCQTPMDVCQTPMDVCPTPEMCKVSATDDSQTESEISHMLQSLSVGQLISLVVGQGMLAGNKGDQVPGSVGSTTTKLLKKGIRNLVMCDGPAGVRLQKRSTLSRRGRIKAIDYPMSLYELLPKWVTGFLLGNPAKETVIYQYVTAFPVATALAQTWNEELAYQMGEAVGHEMERYGVDLWLAPAMNIIRNPLCGRNFEYYSEDPILSGLMGSAITRGVQSVPGRGVTVKHFACNNQEYNRYYMSSNLSEKTLQEIYLKGFEIAVREGRPQALMTAYNKVNGTYSAENSHLLRDVLRNEWGYEGLVMTDWLSVGADKAKEGESILAGVNLIMPGGAGNRKRLRQAYRTGKLGRSELCEAAQKVLMLAWEKSRQKKEGMSEYSDAISQNNG